MRRLRTVMFCSAPALLVGMMVGARSPALASASAEIARNCMHFSYIAYPYKRPGQSR